MDLMFGLATVDKMQGDKEAQQLYKGWTGRESATGRKVRRAVSRALFALAAQLAPATDSVPSAGARAIGTARP